MVLEECGPCPIFAGYTLVFALQLRKKQGKTSDKVAEERQLAHLQHLLQESFGPQRIHSAYPSPGFSIDFQVQYQISRKGVQ
jgi:hypothetical protein